jgi:drug/metabolite transporter (DMT)-like permease
MNPVLICLSVTVAFFGLAIVLGFKLGRSPKPYPKILLITHMTMFFVVAYGIGECLTRMQGATADTSAAKVALLVALGSLWASLASGIVMLCLKKKHRGWILAHKLTMFLAALAFVAAGVFLVMKR